MKNILLILGLFLFIFQTNAQTLKGDSWAKARQSKQAQIIITYTDAPKFAEKVNGQYSGVCFDIMDDFIAFVKSNYGVNLSVTYKDLSRTQDFDLFLNTIKTGSGGVFGLGDVTITEARKTAYTFSPAYFSNVAILATNRNAPKLSSIDKISSEYSGMTAIVQNGTTHEQRMKTLKSKYFPSLKIETTVSFDEANNKVAGSSNYFTYIDFSTYMQVLEQKLALDRQPAGDQKGESFGFIMPKNSDWDEPLQAFFNQNGGYTNSVAYRKILSANLGNYILRLLDTMNK